MKVLETKADEAWLPVALSDEVELLRDHAHCEKKAASSAMMLMTTYHDEPGMVAALADIACEELEHFKEIHALLKKYGGSLGNDDGDPYVKALLKLVRTGPREARLIDRLLVSALIEARSFERLRLLGEEHPNPELKEVFARFARLEAKHGATFVQLAQTVGESYGISKDSIKKRLKVMTLDELDIIDSLPARCAIH